MPDLHEIQSRMTVAILSGDLDAHAGLFRAGMASAGERLSIYRNNTIASLTECLRMVFPVTVKLSDPRFFAYAAHEFITKHPPQDARLSRYGAGFPRFLSGFEACRDFPILAEMAALEWAMYDSLNASAAPAIPLALASRALTDDRQIGLALQPGLRFALSSWPILGVWLDHQKPDETIRGPLRPVPTRIAVMTNSDDIQCLELEPGRFAFWRAAARGASLAEAARKALLRDRLFDVVGETVLLFRSGLVTGVVKSCIKET